MTEKKSMLRVELSLKDTEVFDEVLTYVETLLGILSSYELSDEDRRKLNEVSENIPNLTKGDE